MTDVNLTVEKLKAMMERQQPFFLLDVRQPHEHELCRIEPTHALIPLNELPDHLDELDPNALIVIYCRTGNRSLHAAHFLRQQGFEQVYNLAGGIHQWGRKFDPGIPLY